MRFVNKEGFKTLRFRIGLAFFAIFIPLMIWMLYYSVYAGQVVRDQVAQSNKNLVTLYMAQIDRTLQEADEYLYNMAAVETDLIILDQSEAYYSSLYQEAKIRLFNNMSTQINNNKTMDMFFVYSMSSDDFLTGSLESMTFLQRDQAKSMIKSMLKGEQTVSACTQKWCVQQGGGDYFLSHAVKIGNVYIGAWVNAKRLMVPLSLIDLGDVGFSVLTTDANEPMDHTLFIKENGIDLSFNGSLYKITGNMQPFLAVRENSKKGDFNLAVLLPENGIMEKLPLFQRVVFFVPIGFILMLLLLLLILRKLILQPIYRMLSAMRRFKEGNWDTKIVPYPSSKEFEMMNTTFNEMVSQIEKLKIDVYEEQLNNQRAELKHMQLQINPHFFLNSLNIVYHLAQAQKYELIQEMSLSLVEYFRYMFRSNLTFVPLKDEIKHTSNYLNIQKLRFPKHLYYEIIADDSLEDTEVPPLIVQTFVENTIKHAVTMDDSIHIRIVIHSEPGDCEDVLKISIEDTGRGFPESILQQLQSEQDLSKDNGQNIGIWNVKRRIALLYKDHAKISLSNGTDSGATVEIVLPLTPPTNKI